MVCPLPPGLVRKSHRCYDTIHNPAANCDGADNGRDSGGLVQRLVRNTRRMQNISVVVDQIISFVSATIPGSKGVSFVTGLRLRIGPGVRM